MDVYFLNMRVQEITFISNSRFAKSRSRVRCLDLGIISCE